MRIHYESHPNGVVELRCDAFDYDRTVMVTHLPDVDKYQLDFLQDGPKVDRPSRTVSRFEGERDETFYNRAVASAYEWLIDKCQEKAQFNSNEEQIQFILGQMREVLNEVELTIEHFDGEEPDEGQVGLLARELSILRAFRQRLGDMS